MLSALGLSLCPLSMLCVPNEGRRKEEGKRGRMGGGRPAPDSRRAKMDAGTFGSPVLGLRGDEAVEEVGVPLCGERWPEVERLYRSSLYFEREPGLVSFCLVYSDGSTVTDRCGSGVPDATELIVGIAAGADVE